MQKSFIRFENVNKSFPGVKALKNISFNVQKGSVHALLGENGAGKSTLLSILHGVLFQDRGEIYIDDKPIGYKNVYQAMNFGVAMVYQEVNLVEELTVGQNIALGIEPKRFSFINYKELHKKVDEILRKLGCSFNSRDKIYSLSVGEMQMITIAKALLHDAKIISFDEPTSSLSNKETNILFEIINDLRNQGITVLYVSHRLDEIFNIADKVTILRDGQHIQTIDTDKISKEEMIKCMVGRDISSFASRLYPSCQQEEVVLEVKNLKKNNIFDDISFNLRKGEILGFAGLVGSKRTDVARVIFGADKKTQGDIILKGKLTNIHSPQEALRLGIGLVPEDRKKQGFIKHFSNAENISLTCIKNFVKMGIVNHKDKTKNTEYFIKQMKISPPHPEYKTSNHSGGNQQKVIIAKWLASHVDILILDEPTKGIDVGAKAEIYRLLEELVAKGKSIIIISSELPEVIGMSDRVIVMKEGKKMIELDKKYLDEETIMKYAMGGK